MDARSRAKALVTGKALADALGRRSSIARASVALLVEAVESRKANDRTDAYYREWRAALGVAYGILDGSDGQILGGIREAYGLRLSRTLGDFLFALQTWFAVCARLVAVEVLAISLADTDSRPSTWSSLADDDFVGRLTQLESGARPRGLDVTNLFEGEVFSWYLDRLPGNVALLHAFRGICDVLDRFDFARLACGAAPGIDLFRDFYQGLTTRELRGALGEFLTPPWLAEATLQAAEEEGADLAKERILDCTCGTGTFLLPLLAARLRGLRQNDRSIGAASVQQVLDSVVGIDINPVAVLATRLNYLIALGDLAAAGPLHLPVWRGDIVENSLAPEERFGLVVGNPPWLTFTKLPETWRRKAEPLWRGYGMYDAPRIPGSNEPRSLHTSDIAVLVVAVALDRLVAKGGTLALVVPKALISADPGNRAFRQYRLRSDRHAIVARKVDVPFALRRVHDWSDVRPFSPDAANAPIVIVAKRDAETVFPIAGRRWGRKQTGVQLPTSDWEAVRAGYLNEQVVDWHPISSDPASPLAWWSKDETPLRGNPSPYTFGKGLDTRGANGILFVRPKTKATDGRITIANVPEAGRDDVVKRQGAKVASVEAELVVPIVRGRDITAPFVIDWSGNYLLLAHEPSRRDRPLELPELQARPGAFRYLRRFKPRLTKRKPYMNFRVSEEMYWQVQGAEHMDRGYLTCVTEIANPPIAAVLHAVWDEQLGRTVLPVPDHKIVFFQTESEPEAYFLAGLINSRALQTLLQRFANFTAVSPQTLRYLPLIAFDSGDAEHRELARLAKGMELAALDEIAGRLFAGNGLGERVYAVRPA
jgi:N-6 DNA Methylase